MDDSFWNLPHREMYGRTIPHWILACRLVSRLVVSQLKRNADAQLELIRGNALPKLTSKPKVVLRGRWPTQGAIEF